MDEMEKKLGEKLALAIYKATGESVVLGNKTARFLWYECLRLMAQQEWVKVGERLPGRGETVLVWFGNCDEPYVDCWTYDGSNQYFALKPSKTPEQDVTLWREIVLPKGEKE